MKSERRSSGKISSDLLKAIKEAVNILEVVGEHVVLRKSGANHSGLCPFHSERSPSFSVHEQKQLYHCYGCKKSGDLVTFVQEIHGISFPEAVEELAERARIPLPKDWGDGSSSDDPEVQRRRQEAQERLHLLFKLNLFTMAFYRQQLGQFSLADRYFRGRGVQGDVAANFKVGAAPASWESLARHFIEKKAPLPQAVELGLIRPSTKQTPGGCGYFDLFRNRAMFPIIDMRGRVAGFGGRTLPAEAGAEPQASSTNDPKYMNSPESQIFQKSKLAFGLFQAQKHIREKGEVILVEGYFDVVALHAAGFQNVVAACGTSLTPEHLAIFRRFAHKITILFDGDRAGISATERAMEVGLDHGLVLHGASLPDGLDPDELLFDQTTGQPVAEGRVRMASILGNTQPLLATRLKQEIQSAQQGPEARTVALKKVAAWLGRYQDPVGREVWIDEVERGLGVSRALLGQAMGKPLPEVRASSARSMGSSSTTQRQWPNSGQGQRPTQGARPKGAPLTQLSSSDRLLLAGMARGGEFSALFAEAREKLPKSWTLDELFDYLPAREFITMLLNSPGVIERFRAAPETVLNEELDPQVRSILTEALVSSEPMVERDDFRVTLDRGLAKVWARFSHRITAALADAEAKKDAELHSKWMKEYLDVQRKIKEFNSFYDEA